MSWITTKWSEVVTEAPTGSALPDAGRPGAQQNQTLRLNTHFAFIIWSVVVVQFKRKTFWDQYRPEWVRLDSSKKAWSIMILTDSCFAASISHFSSPKLRDALLLWPKTVWCNDGDLGPGSPGAHRVSMGVFFCLQREILVFLKLELSLWKNETNRMEVNKMMDSSGESNGSSSPVKLRHTFNDHTHTQ